jgi:ketosteroid isomerase-like protein
MLVKNLKNQVNKKKGGKMSILEKYSTALKNKDEAAMNELLHDDFKFTMHKSGNVLTKSDVIKWAMSGDINQDKVRIVYENNEVGIHHAFVTFNDGNVEAVMAVYKYDNGKIISLETGATPMPK